MENQFEKVIDIIIAVIIFFVFPVMYFSQRQETLIEQAASIETSDFIDTVNSHGKLTRAMYEDYISKLYDTKVLYNVKLEHKKLALEPEYRLRTAQEIIDEQDKAYTGNNIYHYFPVSTELPVVNDNVDNSGLVMNTQTNESILANSVHTAADPTHIHTDECYDGGHKHGYHELVTDHVHTDSCHCPGTIHVVGRGTPGGYVTTAYCDICGKHFDASSITDGQRCPNLICGKENGKYINCYAGPVEVYDTSANTYAGYDESVMVYCSLCHKFLYSMTFSQNNWGLGSQLLFQTGWDGYTQFLIDDSDSRYPEEYNLFMIMYNKYYSYDFSSRDKLPALTFTDKMPYFGYFPGCHYCSNGKTFCNMNENPKCHDIVKSIIPTNPVQMVYVGEPLITTAKATYQDGSTGVVLCSADLTASVPVRNMTVTLSYVNINRQTLTCTETVSVIPKTKVCINGHTYNLNADGTDPGCPYCRAWLKSLEIFSPTEGKINIFRGTTLKENGVVLLATYFDGRKEYVENAYVDNLDKYYVGTQNVTISYKGKNVNLIVTTKRNIVQCPVCHHYYELYPDDTDPGCPYCKARTPIFTGNVLKYYSDTYSDEILKKLYEGSGTYYLRTGDYFSVSVTNKSETLGTKVLGFVIHGVPRTSIHVEKGGIVGEDSYGEHGG